MNGFHNKMYFDFITRCVLNQNKKYFNQMIWKQNILVFNQVAPSWSSWESAYSGIWCIDFRNQGFLGRDINITSEG